MSKVNIDVRVKAVAATCLEILVAYQNPAVARHLPFTATDGTVITTVGARPFAGVSDGRLVIGLRGKDCPDNYRYAPVQARVGDAYAAARKTKAAIKELRQAVNNDSRAAIWGAVDAFGGKV